MFVMQNELSHKGAFFGIVFDPAELEDFHKAYGNQMCFLQRLPGDSLQ